MTLIYAVCAWVAWTASSPPAASYDVYVDGIFLEEVIDPTVNVCMDDTYVEHEMYVVGRLNATSSIPSGHLMYSWVPNMDGDGDGVVGFADFGLFVRSFGKCNNGTFEVPCE